MTSARKPLIVEHNALRAVTLSFPHKVVILDSIEARDLEQAIHNVRLGKIERVEVSV